MTNLTYIDAYGTNGVIGSIQLEQYGFLNDALRAGVKFHFNAAFDSRGQLEHYVLSPIPNEPTTVSDGVINYSEFMKDYEVESVYDEGQGITVNFVKKKRTLEELEQRLEGLRHENHELKTKLNAVADEYKLGWNAAKDEIVSTVKHLEGPT